MMNRSAKRIEPAYGGIRLPIPLYQCHNCKALHNGTQMYSDKTVKGWDVWLCFDCSYRRAIEGREILSRVNMVSLLRDQMRFRGEA